MRLKDKKTGESVNVKITFETKYTGEIEAKTYKGEPLTLKLLAERFEDVHEEPFEKVAKVQGDIQIASQLDGDSALGVIQIADRDYYEILPDGTKKTEFTWEEAMEIEEKTHGKWRVPTEAEWFAICAAFGRNEDNTDVDPQVLKKNLNLATDEDCIGRYWSAVSTSVFNSRYLAFGTSYLSPRSFNDKSFSLAVRCVKGE